MSGDPGYFLSHSIGLYPDKAAQMATAMEGFATLWGSPDDTQWGRALAARAEFIALWARLINAPKDNLTTSESVTAALFAVLSGLPDDRLRGRRVLVGADCFPSLHFLLSGMAERRGFILDTVPITGATPWVREEDVLDRLGPDVALTLVTLVTSTGGYRADLNALLPAIRAAGSLVAVDLTQGIGVVPFSVDAPDCDIAISTSLKWLCGAPGAGILYVAPHLLAECQPELRGWFSQPDPFSWALDAFSYAPDARRFDAGTPAPLAAIASVPALRWQAAQGTTALLNHAQDLGDRILEAAPDLGLAPVTPLERNRRGGSVMLRLPDGIDPAAIVAGLRDAELYADARGSVLRLSPGATTAPRHVAALLGRLDELLPRRPRASSIPDAKP